MAIFYTRKANDFYDEGNLSAHRKVLKLVNICDYDGTTKHNDTKYNVFRVVGCIPQWLFDEYSDIILTELPGEKPIRDIPSSVDVLSVMSDDAPTTTNASGGKQSHLGAAFELLPPDALTQVAVILEHGAKKYSVDNWRLIPRHDHLRHALGHIFAYLRNKDTKDLQHAACRILFSLETK